jgi:hypothetical protein
MVLQTGAVLGLASAEGTLLSGSPRSALEEHCHALLACGKSITCAFDRGPEAREVVEGISTPS